MMQCFQIYMKNNLRPIHTSGENVQEAINNYKQKFGYTDSISSILTLGEFL